MTDVSQVTKRVYQFLATYQGDWKTDADKNGDQTVIKSEFSDFMKQNFEWNGEDASAQIDLINAFWKTIDTNQSGKIKGTNLKDKNALNDKEEKYFQANIDAYKELETFVEDNLKLSDIPSEVSNKTTWKNSVKESLANIVEKYLADLKNGVVKEGDTLDKRLKEKLPLIKSKTTANCCAQEYINSAYKDIAKEYDYPEAGSEDLQAMISVYIHWLEKNSDTKLDDAETIAETVRQMIDAYFATAGLVEDNGFDISNYMNTDESAPLNDIQQAVVKKNLTTNLEALKKDADYEANSDLYDVAITNYIEKILNDTKNESFEKVKAYGVDQFKEDEIGRKLIQTIEVKNLFKSDDLKKAITEGIGSSFADKVCNSLMKGEIEAYDKIVNEALEKAGKGEFDNDGKFDKQKAIDWIVDQMKTNLVDFYPDGLNDMSLEELNATYDALVKSAREKDDVSKLKEAAISYCKALCAKSELFAKTVKDVDMFGENYADGINKLTSGEIEAKMAILKEKVLELGDPKTFTLDSFSSGIPENTLTLSANSSGSSFVMKSVVKNGENSVDTTRITYSATTDGGECSIDGNTITIKPGAQAGTYTVKVAVLVDGIQVGNYQEIKMVVKRDNNEVVSKVTGWDGAQAEHLEVWGVSGKEDWQVTSCDFDSLYKNSDAKIILHIAMDAKKNDWGHVAGTVRDRLSKLGSHVVKALSTAGLDATLLSRAASTVIDRYSNNGATTIKNNSGKSSDSLKNNISNYMNSNPESTKSKIMNGLDADGKDSNVYMIRFKDFVDDILNEYWEIAG